MDIIQRFIFVLHKGGECQLAEAHTLPIAQQI